MYRTLVGILAVFALALLLAGLTFGTTVDERADFTFVNDSEPKTLDPNLATGEPEGRLLWELFEGLTRYDPKTMKPAPGVAESWDISEDGKTYVFHLRKNARWSDGTPVTAHDFVYSWRRLLSPELGGEYGYIIGAIELSIELNTFEGLAEVVKKTVRPGIAKLRTEHANGLPAPAFQRALSELKAHEAIGHADDALVADLAVRQQGSVSPAELDGFARALDPLENKLRSQAAEARARFGVDRGAFAKDDHTLIVQLRAPTPYFLEITTFYPTMPVKKSAVERETAQRAWFLPETIVSNGPFRLKSWAVNDRIRLERSETYWGKDRVRLRTIDALAIESSTTALNLFLTGKVDWIPKNYPKDLVDVLRKRPDFYAAPGLIVYYYRLNTTKKPLDDRRVRQAMNYAIDRETIAREILRLGQIPAYAFVPPGLSGYEPPAAQVRFDVARAKALLAEAGFPNGQGFPKLGILYNTHDEHRKVAEVIADQLRRNLGISVTAYNQEWQSYLDSMRYLDYEIARAGWIGDYSDPNTFLDMWVTNGPQNRTGWSSARYDRLIKLAADVSPIVDDPNALLPNLPMEAPRIRPLLEAARNGAGPDRLKARERIRMAVFREAESILVGEELPLIPVYFYVNSGFLRPGVSGFYSTLEPDETGKRPVNLRDVHPLSGISVDREVPRAP